MSRAPAEGMVAAAVRRFADAHKLCGIAVGAWPASARSRDEAWTFCIGSTGAPERSAPVDCRTIWQVGSLTKTFTASMLAAACERGRVALDDSVQRHAPSGASIPVYQAVDTPVAIRLVDLATHTAGLPADPAGVRAGGYALREMYDYLARYALAVPPGKWWNYSNLGFALLADVLAHLDNHGSFDPLLEAFKLSGRFDLPDTTPILSREQASRLAWGFSASTRAPWRTETWPAFTGSGGLYASLDDMLEWLAFNLGRSASPLDCLLPIVQKTYFDDGTNIMGLGWQHAPLPTSGLRYLNKGGVTNGFVGFLGLVTDPGVGVAIMANDATAWPQSLAEEILCILLGVAD